MSRTSMPNVRRWSRRAVLLGVVAFACTGCTPSTLWWLARGDGKVAAEFPLKVKEGQEDIVVLVLGSAPPTLPVEFAGVDRDLATQIGRTLTAETHDDDHPITVIDQAKVDDFKASHPDWRILSSGQIGKQLGADYVLDVDLTDITLYSHDFGREVPQGRASLRVSVYDTASPDRVDKDYDHCCNPRGTEGSPMQSVSNYRRWFLGRIATEVAWKHIPHVYERGIGMGR